MLLLGTSSWGMVKLVKHISFYTFLFPGRLVATWPSVSRSGSGATTAMESPFILSGISSGFPELITYHLAAWLTPLG